ncbi:MAG TPA: type II toxin-antitoxin system prevent-host-death family antitoxin [Acidimicrobiia bacterium]|nr:type II toxin-antitoxin system prevent-host-death family antitoxin [Acidimicrobiia bacterium]
MSDVAARELRNDTRGVLERVEAGEAVTITVSGRPVAVLAPLAARSRWIRRDEFVRRLVQADPQLAADVASLAPDTTDDLDS